MQRIRGNYCSQFSAAKFAIFVSLIAGILSGCTAGTIDIETASPTVSPAPALLGPTSTPAISATSESPAFPTATLQPIPAISDSDHSIGEPKAAITLLVYSDFQCPYCAQFYQAWKQIQELHPVDVRLVFRHFPLLPIHDKADLAGTAAEISGQQGRFWEMHDILFERHQEWVDLDREEFAAWLKNVASNLGMDPELFLIELASGDYQVAMDTAYQAGIEAGIPGTPFIFMNGVWYRLNPTATNLEASIRLELLKSKQYVEPPQVEFIAGTLYFAHFEFDQGEIVVQLFPEQAPAALASFISLAEQGWYDGIGFHSVQPGLLVESGDPTGTGLGGPGYLLLDEISDTLSFDEIGMLAISSSGPNTNGSRFFINLAPLPQLNGSRTIVGRVLSGLEILSDLNGRDSLDDLFEPYELVIQAIRIETR